MTLKEMCEKIGVRFFLAFGTLIGALRHKGFIPWDDDVDVWMPRPDYEKFIAYCREREGDLKPLVLKHYSTCPEYIYPIARLCDSRYKIDYTNAKDYGLGLFVDIYPIDGSEGDERYRRKIHRSIRLAYQSGFKHCEPAEGFFRTVLRRGCFLYSRFVNGNKVLRKIDRLAQIYPFGETELCSCNVWEPEYLYYTEDTKETIFLPFEGELFPAPKGYDRILRTVYGDYMQLPPEEERVAHHFYHAYRID